MGIKSIVKKVEKTAEKAAEKGISGAKTLGGNVVQSACDIKCDKCGKLIPPIVNVSKMFGNKHYQFCSEECANSFKP
ncbi:MAG: hypothetical protein QXT63_00115 [Thermoplasmata archaeon]